MDYVEGKFLWRLGIQQRVLPSYRLAFFETLAGSCASGLSIFAGQPLPQEGITPAEGLIVAHYYPAHNWHLRNPESSFYLCWQGGLWRWLEQWQPDTLIVEANPRYPSTRLAIRWMHQRGRAVIGWGLGAPPITGQLARFRRWERMNFLQSLDGVIAYSRRGAQEYRTLGLPPERVFVALNAVDRRPIAALPARPPVFAQEPNVLFIGRLQARKRVDNLLQACASLPDTLKPRLVIIGDGPARQELEALALRIYPSAEFTGAIHGADLEPYFATADLFALPGTGGLAVQQAMAHGLPVIVAQGDGTQDDLVNPCSGWQVPPDDLQAFRVVLEDALSDVSRLRRMGAEAYRIVDGEINIEAMKEAFVCASNQIRRG